jgi:hypothetical protein
MVAPGVAAVRVATKGVVEMTVGSLILYGGSLVAMYACSWMLDKARRHAAMAKVYCDNAERFYDLTVKQCQDAIEHRKTLIERMFARLQTYSETGRVPPERKPD